MKAKLLGLCFIACSLVILAFPQSVIAAEDDTVLNLEEPFANSTYSGVANLRGWAVSKNGINRIELFIDGSFNTNIPSGASRPDVGDDYPSYPNAAKSGFSMAFNYSRLSPGQHTMLVRAVDNQGNAKAQTITFFTVRFDVPGNFLQDPSKVSLIGSDLEVGGNGRSILVKNMLVDGKTYTILLDWDMPSQGFSIKQLSQTK